MTDITPLRSPTTAVAWATADAIYCEFPTASGVPYVVRYPKTVEGLMEAMGIIELLPSMISPPKQDNHPAITHAPKLAELTGEARNKARGILRRLGMI